MVRFGTAGIRGSVADRVTPAVALTVGQAVGRVAVEAAADTDSSNGPPDVVIGRDGRVTGPALVSAVEAGVSAAGADAVRVGVVPTPTLAFASRGQYGVMLTASHNPPTDNGIKLFADGSEFSRAREQAIETAINSEATTSADWQEWRTTHERDPLNSYRAAVIDYARRLSIDRSAESETAGSCAGLRVAVDCGNGVASSATPQVLRELGAHVVALNANIDGFFPGRPSKPTPETLGDLRQFVADGDFDLGLAHDGDADRIVVLDSDGEVVHEDTILAILAGFYTRQYVAEYVDAEDSPAPVVITTPNASARIDEQVNAAGGRVKRVQLGGLHEGIRAVEASETVVFAAEPWKHIHPKFGGWTDGIASAAVLCRLVAHEGLDSLRELITERPYRKESVDCSDNRKEAVMAALETSLPQEFPEMSATFEHGIRLDRPDGSWLLVRPSGTEPYIRLYAESNAVDELVVTATDCIETAVENAN